MSRAGSHAAEFYADARSMIMTSSLLGRVAQTHTLAPPKTGGDHSVFSSAAITANNVSAWSVDTIWVSPEEVKATPRL